MSNIGHIVSIRKIIAVSSPAMDHVCGSGLKSNHKVVGNSLVYVNTNGHILLYMSVVLHTGSLAE